MEESIIQPKVVKSWDNPTDEPACINEILTVHLNPHQKAELVITNTAEFMEESNWYERGELPPVGTECEYSFDAGDNWCKCKIDLLVNSSHGTIFGAVATCDLHHGKIQQYIEIEKARFRPLQSDRDKLIHEVAQAIHKGSCKNRSYKDIAIAMHDEGLLRPPKDD